MFVGMAWLTGNYMFVWGNFWDKSPSRFLKNLKLPLLYSRSISKFSKMYSGNLSQIALVNMRLLVLIVWSRWSIYRETSYLVCTSRNWKLTQSKILSKDANTLLKISFFFTCYSHFFCYSHSITWFLHQ